MSENESLVASLYTDEDVTNRLAVLLRQRGFSARSAQEAGLTEQPDEAHLAYAATLGLILTPRNGKDIVTTHCQRYAFLHRPPSLFIMVPTNRCNMACVYCHAKAQVLSRKEWDMSDVVPGRDRCMTSPAQIAVKRRRFLSNPPRVDPYTAGNVSRNINGIKFT